MCDTLCVVGAGRTLFGKNSDRPVPEPQVVENFAGRPAGGTLHTQYVAMDDTGSCAVLGSRPTWLWGFEHGVNEHRVAIGNERVWTIDDPAAAEPALIGMDLVRLGLERAVSADEAVNLITDLLADHGQGGVADAEHGEPYWSSFLIADPHGGWVLETSGRTWAARPVDDGAALSNRISLRTDWRRASADVAPGDDFDGWRDPAAPTGHADRRLEATRACVATGASAITAADIVATLRHHGQQPWGAPRTDPTVVSVPPTKAGRDGSGVSVCMHVRGYMTTNASMVAELPIDPDAPLRAWVAVASPCVSVYVPVFPPDGVPIELARSDTWDRFAALRARVEDDGAELGAIRDALGPLESELWDEADVAAGDAGASEQFIASVWPRLDAALTSLGA